MAGNYTDEEKAVARAICGMEILSNHCKDGCASEENHGHCGFILPAQAAIKALDEFRKAQDGR